MHVVSLARHFPCYHVEKQHVVASNQLTFSPGAFVSSAPEKSVPEVLR